VATRAYESVHDFLLDVNRDRSPATSRQATATVQEAAREQPAAKEAEKAVITTDSQGRYRFVVPGGEAPTTETTKAVITKDSQGRDRFVVPLLTTDSQGRDRFVAPGREAPAPQAVREAPAPQAVRTPELVMSMASSTPEVAMPMPSSPFNPAMAVGVTAPLGFFDPLGFSKVGDEAGFRKLRTAEIKHGRVAMMASVGAVIQHFVQLPGFESVPKGLGAVASSPGAYGFTALVLISGALELFLWKEDESKEAGDYGNPLSLGIPLGWSDDMRNAELNNGRAAMFAAVGIIAAEVNTGLDAVQQFN
jgi:light-harvesting complex I chlorophyll a/b binding protein 4